MRFEERVTGCLKGLAVGDAIGKQTETLAPLDVRKWYPDGIAGFHGRPGDVIPRYTAKRYEWRVGETTDDTEQTLAVARALLRQGRATHQAIGEELLRCRKSAHPGVSLWTFLQIGDSARIAADGDGCGAAMRSAPIGVIHSSQKLEDLVRGARECAIPTHGGPLAIGAASAVAGAVSAAIDGRPKHEVLRVAIAASENAPAMASAISEIYSRLAGGGTPAVFPDTTEKIVGLAIGLALVTESAEKTALVAANLGGDADSVASIGGAIAGAMRPESVNADWFQLVSSVNGDDIVGVAAALARMRT